MKRVALGLSGGVDSAVAAALLIEQGYSVTGVFMVCYQGFGCRTDEDHKDALDVALHLGIPFDVLDFRKDYQEKVLDYFYAEYEAGRTPNPDVACNREIKFGMFYDWALHQAYDYVATGHYALIEKGALLRGVDETKDQSYFLYQLKAEQLNKILFPIGGMTKAQVRTKARELKISVADKPDSTGICFIGEVPARKFLEEKIAPNPGKVIDTQGDEIGVHPGAAFFTIGQRHGFEVKVKKADTPALYVVGKDINKNILIVGSREQCMRDEFEVGNLHFIGKSLRGQMLDDRKIQVRIRHLGELIDTKISDLGSKISVKLDKPAFGVAPGQAAVFYDGEVCIGGGLVI